MVETLERPRQRDTLETWLNMLQSDLAQCFLGQHSPDGEPWLPLKRPRSPVPPHNPGRRVLIDFGHLLASVAGKGTGHIETVGEAEGTMGTSIPYAAVHQTGTKDGKIPARPFMGAPAESADELADMVATSLNCGNGDAIHRGTVKVCF